MKVIVNSLPKSGTHLLGTLMGNIGFQEWGGAGLTGALVRETHRDPIKNWRKRKRRPTGGDNGLWIDLDVEENRAGYKWLRKYLNSIPDGMYVSGHLPHSLELSMFLQITDFKVLHITRDPRDVLNSYINFQRNKRNFPFHEEFKDSDLDQAISHTLSSVSQGAIVAAPLNERVKRSMGWLSDTSTYSVHFESLIGPKGGGDTQLQRAAVKGVCEHLGLALGEEARNILASKVFDVSSETFHKGLVNQWKDVFNDEQQDKINEALGDVIETMGYSI